MWQKIYHPSQKGITNFSQGLSGTTHPQLTSLPEEHITETQFTKLFLAVYMKGTQLQLAQPSPNQLPTVKKAGTKKFREKKRLK